MKKDALITELTHLLKNFGRAEIEEALRGIAATSESPTACTILMNKGPHNFPDYLFRGETFVFYEGSADLSSSEALESFTIERLKKLATFSAKGEVGVNRHRYFWPGSAVHASQVGGLSHHAHRNNRLGFRRCRSLSPIAGLTEISLGGCFER